MELPKLFCKNYIILCLEYEMDYSAANWNKKKHNLNNMQAIDS